jgi:hypothetical protein
MTWFVAIIVITTVVALSIDWLLRWATVRTMEHASKTMDRWWR